MKTFRVLAGLSLIGLVAACASPHIEKAASQKPSGAFNTHLHSGYLQHAKDAAAEHDWRTGQYFAGKATAAAKGGVGPTNPAERDFTKKDKKVWGAYTRLKAALASGAPKVAPEACATAQVEFDHWIEEKEECWQPKDINKAYKRFEDAMEKCVGQPAMQPRSYLVFFDWDSSKLTPEANRILDSAAAYIKKGEKAKIILTGYADTSGPTGYNQGLSLRRANAVWSGLIDRGIPQKSMKVFAKGESDPLVATGDGVREPQNRRVHIDINF